MNRQELESKIYEYLKKHKFSTHHTVAKEFNIKEADAMEILHRMRREGKLRFNVAPLGNDLDHSNSTFYSVS